MQKRGKRRHCQPNGNTPGKPDKKSLRFEKPAERVHVSSRKSLFESFETPVSAAHLLLQLIHKSINVYSFHYLKLTIYSTKLYSCDFL
jgi:hypothetical protein